MALPDARNDREYQKFVQDSSGNVAIRVTSDSNLGNVTGPSSAIENAVAVFSGSAGTAIKVGTSVFVNGSTATGAWLWINTPTTTSGDVIGVSSANSLTTGTIFSGTSNTTNTSVRTLFRLDNSGTAANGTTLMTLNQYAPQRVVYVNQIADGAGIVIDSSSANNSSSSLLLGTTNQSTGDIIKVGTANSLTTGSIFAGTSNSTSVGTRSLLKLKNSAPGASGTTVATFTQAAPQRVVYVNQTNDGHGIVIDSSSANNAFSSLFCGLSNQSTGNIISVGSANSLTTGGIFAGTSNSSSNATRSLLVLSNQNTGASNTTVATFTQKAVARVVYVNQLADAPALTIDCASANNTSPGINFNITNQASGNIINVPSANSLTTGSIANLVSNATSTSGRNLVVITNSNTAATAAVPLKITQSAFTGTAMQIVHASSANAYTAYAITIVASNAAIAAGSNAGGIDLSGLTAGSDPLFRIPVDNTAITTGVSSLGRFRCTLQNGTVVHVPYYT